MKARHACHLLAAASVLVLSGAIAQEDAELQPDTAQAAELPRRYVSDKLVLNVYAEPDPASTRVATIETGDAVGEIESSGSYVHVRLEDGREGWVGANYLTGDMPAAARVRELQDRQKTAVAAAEKKAADEIARLKKEVTTLQSELGELRAAATKPAAAPVPEAQIPAPVATDENPESEPATSPADERNAPWIWPIALVLALGFGFAAGYQVLAQRIRKRYGGLKIY